jgi:hypothetical protein
MGAAAWGAEPALRATIVPLRVPAVVATEEQAQVGIFAPDGRLWVAVPAPSHPGVAMVMEFAMPSGRLLLSRRLSSGVAALIVGPDGNIWFAGRTPGGNVAVGRITERGGVRSFTADVCCVDGLAAGPDGAVWLTLDDMDPTVARVSVSGHVSTWQESSAVIGWSSGLVDGADGTLWTSVNHPPLDASVATLAEVEMNGRVRPDDARFKPAVLDATGHLRGWYGLGHMFSLGAGDSLAAFPATGFNAPGATVLGADQRVWFTGDSPISYAPDVYGDQVIGVASRTTPGTAETWPAPFVTADDAAVGRQIPGDDGLFAGPDGRLYALGFSANLPAETMPMPRWHLFAVTLPGHRTMWPASVHIDRATRSGATVDVTVSCTGQSGRFCDGTISVRSGVGVVATSPYALEPGLQATHELEIPVATVPTTVTVTSHDLTARTHQTRRARIPA